jgi:hypothetical protein
MSTNKEHERGALAGDLALYAADVLTLEEIAARADLSVAEVITQMDDPALLALAEKEAARGKLSGATGQVRAIAIRDKALSLLAGRMNEDMSTRVLLDVLNTVRQIAAKDESKQSASGFQLVINLDTGTKASAPEVVDVQAREVKGQ